MMAPLFLVLLAALPVFAGPGHKGLTQFRDYEDRSLVTGAAPATINEFPFVVGLIYTVMSKGTVVISGLCGGTILTEVWVLTSANCADADIDGIPSGAEVQLSHVRAGSSHRNRGGIIRRVTKTVTHKNPPHNIGLVKIDGLWPLNGITISLARLPRRDDPVPEYSAATIVGWEAIAVLHTEPDALMKQEVEVTSTADCNAASLMLSHHNVAVTDTRICTLYECMKKPSSAFQGDSGGPVVVNGEVVGIVIGFPGVIPTFFPNIHTRVSLYIDWIEEIVGPLPSRATSDEVVSH